MKIIFLIIALVFHQAQSKIKPIIYHHHQKTIELYDQKSRAINVKLSFNQKDIILDESLSQSTLYLNKFKKYQIDSKDNKAHIKYNYKQKSMGSDQKDEVLGIVGLASNSQFFKILQTLLQTQQIKLEVKHQEGAIYILNEPCKYPIFPPFSMMLSEVSTKTYTVTQLSTNFKPDISFLKVLGKTNSPFEISKQKYEEQITVSVRNRVISIPLKQVLECGKYSTSDSYQCQIEQNSSSDVGGLLLNFDPIICNSGIEIQKQIEDSSWEYHYSHIVILLLQFSLLLLYFNDERFIKFWNRVAENVRKN